MTETLLPSNATPIEVALDQAGDQAPKIDPALSYISGWKHIVQPPDLRPYLVQEFGMGFSSHSLKPMLLSLLFGVRGAR